MCGSINLLYSRRICGLLTFGESRCLLPGPDNARSWSYPWHLTGITFVIVVVGPHVLDRLPHHNPQTENPKG